MSFVVAAGPMSFVVAAMVVGAVLLWPGRSRSGKTSTARDVLVPDPAGGATVGSRRRARVARVWSDDPVEMFHRWRARRRPADIEGAALALLDAAAPALQAGLTPAAAMHLAAASTQGLPSLEMQRFVDGIEEADRFGLPASAAWVELADRSGSRPLAFVAGAWRLVRTDWRTVGGGRGTGGGGAARRANSPPPGRGGRGRPPSHGVRADDPSADRPPLRPRLRAVPARAVPGLVAVARLRRVRRRARRARAVLVPPARQVGGGVVSDPLLAWLVAVLVVIAVLVMPPRAGRESTGSEGVASGVAGGSAAAEAALTRPDRGLAPRRLSRWRWPRSSGATERRPPGPEAVASALALLALAYRSGLPTWQVLAAAAAQSPADVAADLRQVAAALQWGAGEHEAWASVDTAWAPAARAVSIAHQAGVAPAALLMKAADDTRRADLERLEVAAAQVGVRLVLPLGLVLLPAFCLTTVVPLVVSLGRQLLTSG